MERNNRLKNNPGAEDEDWQKDVREAREAAKKCICSGFVSDD